MNVAGNVAFALGSFYQVEVNPAGQSDRIVATGVASLTGGTVQVLAAGGSYAPATAYTILTASGGVNGTFSTTTSSLAFLTPSLGYSTNAVTLTLLRNDIAVTDPAQSANQLSVARALSTMPGNNALLFNVINQSTAGARQAFDALSGEVHGGM